MGRSHLNIAVTKTLTKQGDDYALVFDQAILDFLDIQPDTPLEISTPDGESIMIRPCRNREEERKRIPDALREVNIKYARALKELAQ